MSFSDFYASDLSDITPSEDEEFTPAKARRTSAKNTKRDQLSHYTIPNPLRPPRSTSYSVRALYEQIVDGLIDLDPDYQRDVVWSEQKQIGLIDSVFRNYYIPPIIFAVSTSDDGSETRTCIDGKQRLTSIQKFMDGLIPHRDHVTSRRYWYKKCGANARILLPMPLQQAFSNKQIVCVEYDSLGEEQEREIFQRVQLGVALTPAERMQAITGPWPNFIREIQSQVLGDHGFGNSFDWGRARGRDFHGLASIVYLIEQLPTCKVPPTSQTMEKWLTRTTTVPPKLRSGVLDTFRVYLSLVREATTKKPFAQRISPIEFVMIGVMIFIRRETLSLAQLSNAVEKMRTDVRSVEKDVRSNGRVSKLLFKFIMEKLPKLVLRSDGQGDKSAQSTLSPLPRVPAPAPTPLPVASSQAVATPMPPTLGARSARALASLASKKRKRQDEDDDSNSSSDPRGGDDEEYIPQAQRSARRPPAKVSRRSTMTRRPPSVPEPVPPPASAPPRVASTVVKAENDSISPTPPLTYLASSATPQTEGHSISAPPAPRPVSSPPIKTEKNESFTVPGPLRTPMDRIAALRAASVRTLASPASVSMSPTAVAPAEDVPPDRLVPGSALSPIDLEALEKLQQVLALSAGLKAISRASPQQETASLSQASPDAPSENQGNNQDAILALQQLHAILAPLPQQQAQQTHRDPPNAIPIPQIPHSEPAAQIPPRLTVKIEPGLSAAGSEPNFAPRSAGSLPHRLNYRGRSRGYDRRGGARRGYGYNRGRGYHHRGRSRSPRSCSPRSRSRSRSRSRFRSLSPSRSRSRSRLPYSGRTRSRSRSRDRDRDYGYHSAGDPPRGRGRVAGRSVGGSRGGSVSSVRGRRYSAPGPGYGYAPRKFDFARERNRREFGYDDHLRDRRTSAGGPGGGGSFGHG